MKPSKYNYILENEGNFVFFNGITESSFQIASDYMESYKKIIDNPDDNYTNFNSFIDKMKVKGFIIEDETDEQSLIMQKYTLTHEPNLYEIMILPTYQCNLRCWYCVQEHKDLWISDEDVEKIKKRITRVMQEDEVKALHISWFGGEPILAYDRIVEISEWAINLCDKLNKEYYATITTNATLLTKERIEKLRELKVVQYQITIDGDRLTHNSIKVLGQNSAFDVSLANISEIARHTRCTLRFNYTKDNLKPDVIIEDIKSRIPKEVRQNITFLIYKVWQETPESIDLNAVNRLVELSSNEDILPQLPSIGMCYADNKYFDCVFSNGKIGKCDNSNPDSKHVCGEIGDDGEIIWEGENYSLPGIFDEVLKANECLECKYFPTCWGPCPIKREKMMETHGKVICHFRDKDKEMREFLLNSFKNAVLRKNTIRETK